MPKLHNLEVLNFGDCLIRTGGALSLAKSLKQGQTSLTELVLSGNEIRQPGALAITESVADMESLKILDLNSGCFLTIFD